MKSIEEKIRDVLLTKGVPHNTWVNVQFVVMMEPDGTIKISAPTVRTPWIPVKSKQGS